MRDELEHKELIKKYYPKGVVLNSIEDDDKMWDTYFPAEIAKKMKEESRKQLKENLDFLDTL